MRGFIVINEKIILISQSNVILTVNSTTILHCRNGLGDIAYIKITTVVTCYAFGDIAFYC